MDTSKIGVVAGDLMELVAEVEDDDCEVGEVMILVEISGTTDEDEDWTYVRYRCSDGRQWVQEGMLHYALYGGQRE